MDSLKGMAIFATVVDKGSMAAAAQSLGMTPSAVSSRSASWRAAPRSLCCIAPPAG